jgi:hypothetical protein
MCTPILTALAFAFNEASSGFASRSILPESAQLNRADGRPNLRLKQAADRRPRFGVPMRVEGFSLEGLTI